jgi:hypothetical protein
MIADFNSTNAVLIHYRGGAYGNFMFHAISNHIDNTVKISNDNFTFSRTGDSHSTAKYVSTYYLAGQLGKHLKSYSDYNYTPTVTDQSAWQQIQDGKKFLVLCDTSVIDNHRYLLSMWPNGTMIRSYMPNFVDRLVGYANLIHKALSHKQGSIYKNSLFDNATIDQFRDRGGDLDQLVEDALVQLFQQDFNLYGKTFNKPAVDNRIFNFNIECLTKWTTFELTMRNVASFLNSTVANLQGLQELYSSFYKTQSNLTYYQFNKDTVPDQDDLIGRALVKFYQQ